MSDVDMLASGEVRDRPRYLPNAIEPTDREMELCGRPGEQLQRFSVELAMLTKQARRELGIEPYRSPGETPQLFALRVQRNALLPADSVRSITDTYLDVRYGPPNPVLLQRLETDIAAL